jgi:UDP-glucose 4-epimerase
MNNAVTKNVLVTGGAGNLSSGHTWAAKWGPLERGGILNRTALDRAIEKYRPSACLHFAAFAYVGESVSDPARLISNSMRAASELQWRPHITGLDDIISTAWEWHKRRAQEKSRR